MQLEWKQLIKIVDSVIVKAIRKNVSLNFVLSSTIRWLNSDFRFNVQHFGSPWGFYNVLFK